MPRTALKSVPKLTLEDMIDQYGELSAQVNTLEKQKKFLKQQIDAQVLLPEGEDSIVFEGNEYQAEKYIEYKTVVVPEKVKEYDEDTFWRLVKIGKGDAEAVLSPDVFRECSVIEPGQIPSMKIVKRK